MTDLPVPLNPGEAVLKEAEAVYPKNSLLGLGYNPVFGHLWLTDQRLIFHGTIFGQTRIYPLSRVVNAAPTERQIKTAGVSVGGADVFTQWSTLTLVEFDNGGREYFAVKDMAGWTEGILAAKVKAPPLDYVVAPNTRPGVETTFGKILLWFGGFAVALCVTFACCSTLTLFSPAIFGLVGGGGK